MPQNISPTEIDPVFQEASKTFTPFAISTNSQEIEKRQTANESLSELLIFGVPAIAAGFADTLGQSVGLIDQDDLQETLKENFPRIGDLYARNKVAFQTIGDLTGMMVTGTVALKAYRAAGILARRIGGARRSKLLESLFTRGGKFEQQMADLRAQDQFLAKAGQLDLLSDTTRKTLARKAITTRITDTVKENIAFELGVFALMNDSQTLYPDEFSTGELIALNAVFPATFAIAETFFVKRLIRNSAQSVAGVAARARNPENLPLNEIINRPGNRDIGITIEATALRNVNAVRDEAVNALETTALNSKQRESFRISQTNLNREALTLEASVKEQVEKAFKDTPIKDLTSRVQASDAEKATALAALKDDPNALLGVIGLENLPSTRSELMQFFEKRDTLVKKLQADIAKTTDKFAKLKIASTDTTDAAIKAVDNFQIKITEQRRQLDELQSLEFYVVERDGSLVDIRQRKPLFHDNPTQIRIIRETQSEQKMFQMQLPPDAFSGQAAQTIGITADLQIIAPGLRKNKIVGINTKGKVSIENLHPFEIMTLYQRSGVYAGLQRTIKDYKPGEVKFNISATDHHTRLDSILDLHQKTEGRVLQDVTLPPGMNNIDDIEFASLSSKFEEYSRLRTIQDNARAGQIKIPEERIFNSEDIRKMLNLPAGYNGDAHPLITVFEAFYQQKEINLKDAIGSLENLKRAVQEDAFTLTQTAVTSKGIQLHGDMLNIDLKKQPFVAIKRPVNAEPDSRKYLEDALTKERTRVMTMFAGADAAGAELLGTVFKKLMSLPDAVRVAKDVDTLIEGIQRGRGAVVSQAFAMGENATMQSIHNLQLLVSKAFRLDVDKAFKKHTPTFSKLKNPNNRGDLNSFNLYKHARQQGWDVKDPIPASNNPELTMFPLSNTKPNRDKFRKMFNKEMPEGALMPAQGKLQADDFFEYKPLAVTELGMEGARAIDDLDQMLLRNINYVRKIMGQGEIRARPWHVPPKNFSKQEVSYVMNTSDEIVSVHSGNTLATARAKANQSAELGGKGHYVVDRTDTARYMQIQDRHFETMMDFTDPSAQTGRITGKQVGAVVDVGQVALNDTIESIKHNFESILRRGMAVFFEPEINYARKRFQASGSEKGKKGQTIWQQYLAEIFGNPTLNPNDMIGITYFGIERIYDDVLSSQFGKVLSKLNPTKGLAYLNKERSVNKSFNKLETQLGEHNPFMDAADFAARTHNVEVPPSMKKHMAKINSLTTLLTLRLFEVGHSILTLSSLGATIPGVVAALKRIPGETEQNFAARIGAFGQVIDKDVAMWSPTKAMISATHFMFTKEGHEVLDRANKAGFLDQQVAEIFRTITAPSEGYWEGIIRRSTNMVSALSDNSEKLARGISFMTGYNLGKRALGFTDENVLFAFANHFANQVIGDYSPNNRPRMFQGAAGMPLGLFMTFMWNYYQRIFSYVESKQTRALVTQFATQAAVFGAETVPGFQQYNDFFFTNWDGTANPVDAMNNRFGPEFTEWFMNGILGNVPKMFGYEDGVAIGTRGDVNFRNVPTLFTLSDTPVFAMFRDFYNATRESFGRLRTQGNLSIDDMAEIAQSYSTNRALRNVASLYTGFITDRRGQVISTTPTFGDIMRGEVDNEVALMARVAGLRTLHEKRSMEASFKNRTTDLSRRYRMGELRDGFRTHIRAGTLTEPVFSKAIANYVKFGGRPEYFPRWVVEQFMVSQTDKATLELMKIIKNPQKSDNALRLLHVIAPVPVSEQLQSVGQQ